MWSSLKSFFAQFSTFQLALGFSLLFHTVLIAVRFVDPEGFNRVFKDTPLEVVLVNTKSDSAPDKAQAIAQFNLAGGGEADKGLASSPLPPMTVSDTGDSVDSVQQQIDAMQQQQMRVLTDLRSRLQSMPVPNKSSQSEQQYQELKRQRSELKKILAAIEKRINEENARPKKRYISPATRQEHYALYYDGLRRKIEEYGTQNFPESSSGKKLHGELTLAITINSDGKVIDLEVVESSGSKVLDRRAQVIAKQSSPFGVFSSAMRVAADQLVVVSRFKFTRDETLETTLTAQ